MDVILFSCNVKIKLPFLLIAEMAEIPPRFPVTFCMGVLPRGDQVFPNRAVNEMLDSSSKYRIALYFLTVRRILSNSFLIHTLLLFNELKGDLVCGRRLVSQ